MCQYDVAIIIEQLRKKQAFAIHRIEAFRIHRKFAICIVFYVSTLHVSLGLSVVHPPVCPAWFTVKFTPATLKRVATNFAAW